MPRPFFPSPAKKRPGNEARFILLLLLPLGAKSENHTFFATLATWRIKRKSHDSYFCHFFRLAQKAQIILFLPLLPLGAKSANPMIHTFATCTAWRKKRKSYFFATFAAWRKQRKSNDSLLPLGAKSANPMIHTFATFAAWRKKRKSYFFATFAA